jgi:glycosyltransferase involved in cell wall biosynthesis
VVKEFHPDLINIWSMYGLSGGLLPLPRMWGIPDVYWIEQGWIIDNLGVHGEKTAAFWESVWEGSWGPPMLRPLARVFGSWWEARTARDGLPTRNFSVRPAHVVFVSRFMAELHREAGLSFPSSEVIHGGLPVDRFYQSLDARQGSDQLRLLYAGQLSSDRGLHTVIEALARLDPSVRAGIRLDVVGKGSAVSDYEASMKARVVELGLSGCVTFRGETRYEEMPGIYQQHDLLIFSSARAEGLPLTMIEAMLAGCAVVTTGAGGAREIAEKAELPTFPPDDYASLARLLSRLFSDRAGLKAIAERGQRVAGAEFSFDQMMARFAASLEGLPKRTG